MNRANAAPLNAPPSSHELDPHRMAGGGVHGQELEQKCPGDALSSVIAICAEAEGLGEFSALPLIVVHGLEQAAAALAHSTIGPRRRARRRPSAMDLAVGPTPTSRRRVSPPVSPPSQPRQAAFTFWVRPDLIAPNRVTSSLRHTNVTGILGGGLVVTKPGDWIVSNQTINTPGHVVSSLPLSQGACANGSFQACIAALAKLHLRELVTYQPASHYWALQ